MSVLVGEKCTHVNRVDPKLPPLGETADHFEVRTDELASFRTPSVSGSPLEGDGLPALDGESPVHPMATSRVFREDVSWARSSAGRVERSRRIRLRSILFIIAADAFLVASYSHGRPVRPNAPDKGAKLPGEDWVQLFNGKDLTGWTEVGKEKWEVEDGVLRGRAITKAYGYLQDRQKLQGFSAFAEVQVQWEREQRGLLHVEFKPGTAEVIARSAV